MKVAKWILKAIGYKSSAPEFDATFYKSHYKDLGHLGSKAALKKHYLLHGKQEGRFPNLDALESFYKDQFRELPSDFDPIAYKALNPDLGVIFDTDWQLKHHFLTHGRREGRAYQLSSAQRPWSSIFRLQDFLAAAEWLDRSQPITLAAALEVFESEGIRRLSPINFGKLFDPKFNRLFYAKGNELSDHVLYHNWLKTGFLNGEAASEQEFLSYFLTGGLFPDSFDWSVYSIRRRLLRDQKVGRIRALQHLFDKGFEGIKIKEITGDKGWKLYQSLGEYHLVRKNNYKATTAFSIAIQLCEETDAKDKIYHLRGDSLRNSGNMVRAISDYVRACESKTASVWSYVHAAKLSAEQDNFERAIEILRQGRPTWLKSIEFRQAVEYVIDSFFETRSDKASNLYNKGDRSMGDRLLKATAESVVNYISDLVGLPESLGNFPEGHVVLIANQDLRQCKHYRVDQKVLYLKLQGVPVRVFDQSDSANAMGSFVGARAAIFYRVPAFPRILEAILTANALGVPTFYDIDDLIFDSRFPEPIETYEDQISSAAYAGLQYGVPLYKFAIGLCRYGMSSTEPLAREVARLVTSGQSFVLRNGLDARNDKFLWADLTALRNRNRINVFYGSGTLAHSQDFSELVVPALEILLSEGLIRIIAVGHVNLPSSLMAFGEEIVRIDFVPDVDDYWNILRSCDISIACLFGGIVTDCKSELKWLEAAVCGVPSIVSDTENYRNVLIDQVDALFARSSEEWELCLRRLVKDENLRVSIGSRAKEKAKQNYNAYEQSNRLVSIIDRHLELNAFAGETEGRPSKPKIMVCNVFFPPQTYGGATRVVKDNIDILLENDDEFEFVMVSTDEGVVAPNRLRVDNYRGIPVFRMSTPLEPRMDSRPFNQDNSERFFSIIDAVKPDLIHFHCIQRLTATIVEAAVVRRIPFIITVHDGWWLSDNQFFVDEEGILSVPSGDIFETHVSRENLIPFISRSQNLRCLMASAQKVLAVSDQFGSIYRDVGLQNVVVVSNGVPRLPARKPKSQSMSGRLRLGHIGGRTVHKGATLVEAVLRFGAFEKVDLTMVDMVMEPSARVETMWGQTSVQLRGPCPQSEIEDLYASLDVLLAPSTWPESFGLVVREAQAAGLWVVASDRGAIGASVTHGVNGFIVDVSSAQELRAIIQQLNDNHQNFRYPPPAPVQAPRTAHDQAMEIRNLYLSLSSGIQNYT